MIIATNILHKRHSPAKKPGRCSVRVSLLFIIILLSILSCNRKNLWENKYVNNTPIVLPDVTMTSVIGGNTEITSEWIDPVIADLDRIEITCTGLTGTIEVLPGIQTCTITGLTNGTEYTVNIRVTDLYDNTSPGVSFSITPQVTPVAGHFIYTIAELDAVRGGLITDWNIGDYYYLMTDLDLSGYDPGDGLGWVPVGYSHDFSTNDNFTGNFDGKNHIISNLTINRSSRQWVGLFMYIDSIGSVKNLTINTVNIYGSMAVGVIAGRNDGTVTNCLVTGTGTVGGTTNIGGLIGTNNGNVTGSDSSASVTAGNSGAGGLIGVNSSGSGFTISNCHATGDVEGVGDTGGLIGNNSAGCSLDNCSATGDVTGNGDNTGGLIGYNSNTGTGTTTLNNCRATGAVSGLVSTGGLIGFNNNASTGSIDLTYCYTAGGACTVSGTGNTGGLVGHNLRARISYCTAVGDITGTGNSTGGLVGHNDNGAGGTVYAIVEHSGSQSNVDGETNTGGLIGQNYFGSISDCNSIGMTITGGFNTGGLVGYTTSNEGIVDSYAISAVSGNDNAVGGLVGRNYSGPINNSWATGSVTVTMTFIATADACAGGLVGYIGGGSITSSYATGAVNATFSSSAPPADAVSGHIGGLVGYISDPVPVERSRATGSVTASFTSGTGMKRIVAGGLIGTNSGGLITLCYHHTGDINTNAGTASISYAGGLIGFNSAGTLNYSFTEGTIRGNPSSNQGTGGLVGYNTVAIEDSYAICIVEASGDYAGGFIGYNDNIGITNSYSAGPVGGSSVNIGGFCGCNNGGVAFTSCYYDTTESGQSDTGKGEPVTSTLMKDPNDDTTTYSGWDFPFVWVTDPDPLSINNNYPYLVNNPPQ